jgi:hypothetical protein
MRFFENPEGDPWSILHHELKQNASSSKTGQQP